MLNNRFPHVKAFSLAEESDDLRIRRLIYKALKMADIGIVRIDATPEEIQVKFRDAKTKASFENAFLDVVAQQSILNTPFLTSAKVTTLDPEQYYRNLGYQIGVHMEMPTYSKPDEVRQRAQARMALIQQAADQAGINVHIALREPTPENMQKYVILAYLPPQADKTDFNKIYRRLSASEPSIGPAPTRS